MAKTHSSCILKLSFLLPWASARVHFLQMALCAAIFWQSSLGCMMCAKMLCGSLFWGSWIIVISMPCGCIHTNSSRPKLFIRDAVMCLNAASYQGIEINTLRLRQNGRYFTDNILRLISFSDNCNFERNFTEICSLWYKWKYGSTHLDNGHLNKGHLSVEMLTYQQRN